MWLRDLKQKNKDALNPSDDSSTEKGRKRDTVFVPRCEQVRLSENIQALHDELAETVTHVDPAEYSDEKIELLLRQAKTNDQCRKFLTDWAEA